MTELFHLSGLNFGIAHCNFQLRDEESDGDQQFVEKLSIRTGHPFFVKRFDTLAFSEANGISIEMAAREIRYKWFGELAEEHGYDYIAVAHNQNDVIETVLLNFARGTGIRGLTGIKPQTGRIIRPLLFTSRHEIQLFAESHKLTWREDSSNAQIKYIRNRIRHEIVPEFVIINPSFVPNAIDTISRIEQIEKLLDHLMESVKKEVLTEFPERILIDIAKLQQYPAVESLLFELLRPYGCNQGNIMSLMNSFSSISGKYIITRTHTITRDRTQLIITHNGLPDHSELQINAETAIINNPVQLSFRKLENRDFVIPKEPCFAVLDADKISYPLILRKWKPGDSFQPLGLKGSKKISDYLINSKVPLPDKKNTWVIESGGTIIWLVNHRIDNRFKITPQSQHVLLIEYSKPEFEP
jgi:tRNA(Ile)-lysidine synthase